jgi:rhamnogalacturonan acetylesterase
MSNPFVLRSARVLTSALFSLLFLFHSSFFQVAHAGAPARPTIFLIGDSTVRNGRGDGAGGLWGWGDFLVEHFDTNKVRVMNRALGGRSSRTFLTEGLWEKVRNELRAGDFVLVQFGHNDSGEIAKGDRPRASLKGNGDEAKDVVVEKTDKAETVRSYGWYLRHYIADAKAAGATPIVLSPIPRNIWKDGKVARAKNDYGKWAAEAAAATGAQFVDLNELIANGYEEIGEAKVAKEFFTPADHTHTTRAGAIVNAERVVAGLRALPNSPFASFLAAATTATPGKVPDKVVVLTFDDAPLSHATNVAPLLKKYGFGGTFFVCEFPGVFGNTNQSMSWNQIRELHRMGFEVASHTRTHKHVDKMRPGELEEELGYIEERCAELGIPRLVSFAYPAYITTPASVKVLAQRGYQFARGGESRAYDPAKDDPRLVPSFSSSGNDEKSAARVLSAFRQARDGRIVVLTVHGVPDVAHPHVNTPPELFERYLTFLKDEGYTVLALRDIAKYLR